MGRSVGMVLGWAAAGLMAAAGGVYAGESAGGGKCPHVNTVQRRVALAFAEGGYVGLSIDDLSAEELRQLKIEESGGARVTKVLPGGPGERAGVRNGDVIIRFHGEAVVSARRLVRMIQETPAGRTAKVELRRDGAPMTLSVTVGEGRGMGERLSEDIHETIDGLKELKEPAREKALGLWREWAPGVERLLEVRPSRLGVRFQEIEGQLARYFHVSGESAVLVTEVEADSPAARAGLKAGDVIVNVGGEAIAEGAALRRRVMEADEGALAVKILREGRPLTLEVTLPRRETTPRSKC